MGFVKDSNRRRAMPVRAPVTCKVCKKMFSKQSNLNRHLRNVHYIESDAILPACYEKSRWNHKCLETNCNRSYQQNAGLINHLRQFHKFEGFDKAETVVFQDKSEFENWKNNIESENKCNYVVSSRSKSFKGQIIYYNCNRTTVGKQPVVSENRKRRLKRQGSCKLNFACTSQVKLTILANNENANDSLMVEWQKTHYGHDCRVEHLRLRKKALRLFNKNKINDGENHHEVDCDDFKYERHEILKEEEQEMMSEMIIIKTDDTSDHTLMITEEKEMVVEELLPMEIQMDDRGNKDGKDDEEIVETIDYRQQMNESLPENCDLLLSSSPVVVTVIENNHSQERKSDHKNQEVINNDENNKNLLLLLLMKGKINETFGRLQNYCDRQLNDLQLSLRRRDHETNNESPVLICSQIQKHLNSLDDLIMIDDLPNNDEIEENNIHYCTMDGEENVDADEDVIVNSNSSLIVTNDHSYFRIIDKN